MGLVAIPGASGRCQPGGGGPSGNMNMTASINLVGRADVAVVTLAGDQQPGSSDGPGHAARFDRPTGLALDGAGNIYVADTGNNRIRRISAEGDTTTIAGGESGFVDGPAISARFTAPTSVCVGPDQSIYVADTGNHSIRRILNGQVTTIAAGPPGSTVETGHGPPQNKLFTGVAFTQDTTPGVFAADAGACKLQQYGAAGSLQSERRVSGRPLSVYGNPRAAVLSDIGTLEVDNRSFKNIPIQSGSRMSADQTSKLTLRHPVGLCRIGAGWLLTDNNFGAVLLVEGGKAQIVAGYCSTAGPFAATGMGPVQAALSAVSAGWLRTARDTPT